MVTKKKDVRRDFEPKERCNNCYYGKMFFDSNKMMDWVVCERFPLRITKFIDDWCGEWRLKEGGEGT